MTGGGVWTIERESPFSAGVADLITASDAFMVRVRGYGVTPISVTPGSDPASNGLATAEQVRDLVHY